MRFPQLHLGVGPVKTLSPEGTEIGEVPDGSRLEGLAAAVDTAAGAGHDFDELIVGFAFLDGPEDLLGVGKAGADGDFQGQAAHGVGGFLDAFGSPDFLEVQRFAGSIPAGEPVGCGAEGSLHNAASCAEDQTGAGVDAKRCVVILVGEVHEVKAGGLDHPGKLPGSQGNVHIGDACGRLVFPSHLKFLGGAGHDGDHSHVLGVDAQLFGVPGLGHGAEHLLGRLAAGQVGEEFGEIVLAVLDPSGRAGGDERQGSAVLDSIHQLGGLFHDGQVSGKVGVEHFRKAQAPESGYHLAFRIGSDGHAEGFADGHTGGRSGLDDDSLGGVGQELQNVLSLILLGEGAGGAGYDALAAGDAGGLAQRGLKRTGDVGAEPTLVGADDAHVLPFAADGGAAAAEHALVVVADHVGCGVVDVVVDPLAVVNGLVGDAVVQAELLELTFAGLDAGETFPLVGGEDQL